MIETKQTPYGKLIIGSRESLFQVALERMEAKAKEGEAFSVGLTGGSTPKAFYRWVTDGNRISSEIIKLADWTVSDERMVPLDSDESNFGNADRMLLTPLGVSEMNKSPWSVESDPHSAAFAFATRWEEKYGPEKAFDLCFLGMGDDGHTASIFPGSPLFVIESNESFASVEVPEKGWRLSITPLGLSECGEIIIMVTGAGKASMLKEVLEGPEGKYPIQLLKRCAQNVTWLVDQEAAAHLG